MNLSLEAGIVLLLCLSVGGICFTLGQKNGLLMGYRLMRLHLRRVHRVTMIGRLYEAHKTGARAERLRQERADAWMKLPEQSFKIPDSESPDSDVLRAVIVAYGGFHKQEQASPFEFPGENPAVAGQ